MWPQTCVPQGWYIVCPEGSLGADACLHQPSTPCPAGIMTDGAGVPTGTPLSDPPLVEAISEDPVLRNTKLIAEAWDCDGLNQVGVGRGHVGRQGGAWAGMRGKWFRLC